MSEKHLSRIKNLRTENILNNHGPAKNDFSNRGETQSTGMLAKENQVGGDPLGAGLPPGGGRGGRLLSDRQGAAGSAGDPDRPADEPVPGQLGPVHFQPHRAVSRPGGRGPGRSPGTPASAVVGPGDPGGWQLCRRFGGESGPVAGDPGPGGARVFDHRHSGPGLDF